MWPDTVQSLWDIQQELFMQNFFWQNSGGKTPTITHKNLVLHCRLCQRSLACWWEIFKSMQDSMQMINLYRIFILKTLAYFWHGFHPSILYIIPYWPNYHLDVVNKFTSFMHNLPKLIWQENFNGTCTATCLVYCRFAFQHTLIYLKVIQYNLICSSQVFLNNY